MTTAQETETPQVVSNDPTALDLVNVCLDRDAMKASDMLSNLLGPKLVDAIQTKKVEVAQSIYGTLDQQDVDVEAGEEALESDEESVEDTADDIEAADDTSVDLEDETEEENENA